MYVTKLFIAVLVLYYVKCSWTIKTCSTWTDYWKIFGENSCKYNLDADDDFVGIVERWGKEVETHVILTYDGYYLTLFRIVPEKNDASPVLILHGIFMNSIAMVDRGNKSLAYQFVKEGYDVWILNWRGTKYSKKHIAYSASEGEYWKFSFNEWGTYDLPQAIFEIRRSNNRKVLIVGYEFGNTAALIYSSLYPDEAEANLNGVVSLSPTGAPIDVGLVTKQQFYSVPFVVRPLKYLNHGEIPSSYLNIRGSTLCRYGGVWIARLCDAYFMAMSGLDIDQQDPETLPVIVVQNKDSNSVMHFEHAYQMMRSKKFQQYDYGRVKNVAKYGGENPPEYALSNIKVPQLFYVGRNDKAGTIEDASTLFQRIPAKYQQEFYVMDNSKFGLADFIQAKDINEELHTELMSTITKFVPAVAHE